MVGGIPMMMLMFDFMFIAMPTIQMVEFISMLDSAFMSMPISVMNLKNLSKSNNNILYYLEVFWSC